MNQALERGSGFNVHHCHQSCPLPGPDLLSPTPRIASFQSLLPCSTHPIQFNSYLPMGLPAGTCGSSASTQETIPASLSVACSIHYQSLLGDSCKVVSVSLRLVILVGGGVRIGLKQFLLWQCGPTALICVLFMEVGFSSQKRTA